MKLIVTTMRCSGCNTKIVTTDSKVKCPKPGCGQAFFRGADDQWHNEFFRKQIEKRLKKLEKSKKTL